MTDYPGDLVPNKFIFEYETLYTGKKFVVSDTTKLTGILAMCRELKISKQEFESLISSILVCYNDK